MATDTGEQLIQLDPTKVLAEDNIRFAILQSDKDVLKEAIKAMGGVKVPVEVEVLAGVKGFTHKLTTGFRRHASVLELNRDERAGLTLPAIVRTTADATDRLRTQLSENLDRKNLSPMDLAVAIDKLFKAGLTRIQVRESFPRPTGKKGTPEPASNAWVNMTLSFLELPKTIQAKIHDGSVGVKAAYELTKVTPDKRAAVLERAEKDMEKEREKEEAEEKKYLALESKIAETAKASEEAAIKLDEAKAELEIRELAAQEAAKKATALYEKTRGAKGDDKTKLTESFKAAETDAKAADKHVATAKKELDKLTDTHEKTSQQAEELKAKLEEARKAAPKPSTKKGVSDTDVKKAAKAEGVEGAGVVQLNATDMRKTIADLALPGPYAKVTLIGVAIKKCFDGISTPGEMLKELAAITGDKLTTPKKTK